MQVEIERLKCKVLFAVGCYVFHQISELKIVMEIIEFTEMTDLKNQAEYERAKLVFFYNYKETGINSITLNALCDIMQQFGFSRPNASRLRDKLIKGKTRTMLVKANGELEMIPIICQELEREYGVAWNDTVSIKSNSELIDEIKFCGKKPYIDQIIKQINFVYANNCYDACAILMRRLFEILFVLAYQRNGIEAEITNSQGQQIQSFYDLSEQKALKTSFLPLLYL